MEVFDNDYCYGTIKFIDGINMQLLCNMKISAVGSKLYWWAAAPPTFGIGNRGMPYANAVQAYDNTSNKGIISIDEDNKFILDFKYPNAYYIGLGSYYVSPHINFKLDDKTNWSVSVGDGIPFKMLTYPGGQNNTPARTGPLFYSGENMGARSQESILYASAYPTTMAPNFWGKRPPAA